jgi:hypothetical protein
MITMSYPYTSPTVSLTLRNPEPGNSTVHSRKLVFRKSMSGDLHTHVSVSSQERLVLTFVLLTDTMIDGLLSFIKTVRHNEFKYIDHESTTYRVKLPLSNYQTTGYSRYGKIIRIELEVI